MKRIVKNYFLHMCKPCFSVIIFLANFRYLIKSNFANDFYFILYAITFLIKPFFFLLLFFGLLIHLHLKTVSEILMTTMIVICIFFGLPIKEYSEFFSFNTEKLFFEGREYVLDEYMTNHYIVNILIENIPITVFCLLNNFFLGKYKDIIIDPIIMNLAYIFTGGIMMCFFYFHRNF